MKEIRGNIWDFHKKGHWIVITTNGTVKSNGEAVMGRGVALQAKQRFPKLPGQLGKFLREFVNTVHPFPQYRLITFPVKHNWNETADPALIEESCQRLLGWFSYDTGLDHFVKEVYMVRPGCGNGGLDWKDVKPVLEKYLDDRFIVVQL